MAHKRQDINWNIEKADGSTSWDLVPIAVLMDIREELKRLNFRLAAVGCIDANIRGLRRDVRANRKQHRRTM